MPEHGLARAEEGLGEIIAVQILLLANTHWRRTFAPH